MDVSWGLIFYTIIIFAVLFGGVRKGTDGFMGVSECGEIFLFIFFVC